MTSSPTSGVKAAAATLAATMTLAPATTLSQLVAKQRRRCGLLFTVRMGERAARAVYRDGHRVTLRDLRLLGYRERCQRNPRAQGFVRWFDRHQAAVWKARRAAQTASGWAIPAYVVMCESRGRNLPPNSADASGYYQILGSTWSAYGGSAPYEAYLHSKPEQDRVAARIWRLGGPSQWVCAG